jgi:hypothetical protein
MYMVTETKFRPAVAHSTPLRALLHLLTDVHTKARYVRNARDRNQPFGKSQLTRLSTLPKSALPPTTEICRWL